MLILGKSEWKFSITSNFAIIVFSKTVHFTLLLNQIFFFIRDVFGERTFPKEHPIGFRGSFIIEKHILSPEHQE